MRVWNSLAVMKSRLNLVRRWDRLTAASLAENQHPSPRAASTRLLAVAALLALLALPGLGRADTNATATLRGRVVYADGQPAAGALVDASIAIPESLKEAYRARTDADGHFLVPQLPPGKYELYSIVEDPNGGRHSKHLADAEVRPGETATVTLGAP